MHEFLSDPRYGVRVLARRPGFTLVAVLALALGIGANTAIFSVVNTVLLQPLPYDDPGRLVTVRETFVPRFPVFAVAPGSFREWKARTTTFQHLAAVQTTACNLPGGDEPERCRAPGCRRTSSRCSACRSHWVAASRPARWSRDATWRWC